MTTPFTLVGRSSSSFTRVARIFALELEVDVTLRVLARLTSLDVNDYAGNPALRIPVLEASSGTWFGALNVCRELARCSASKPLIVWPENLTTPVSSNAQELVVQAMASEVTLIMARAANPQADEDVHKQKVRLSLQNSLAWLERHWPEVLAALPPQRALSFVEVTLFCLVRHLSFREVCDVREFVELSAFCERFEARRSARETEFRYD